MDAALRRGLKALGMDLDDTQIALQIKYLDLLLHWNKAYNLTAVTDPMDMVHLHLLDSLAIAPYLRGQRFIDVGTGPGLPGIPLAIAMPQRQFTLLDSNGKRVRFLFQVRTALDLDNVFEVHSRVEHYRPDQPFDGVISRAYTALDEMTRCTSHLLSDDGTFFAMKGRYPDKELSALAKPYNVCACHKLAVPGVEGERHLIEIGKLP